MEVGGRKLNCLPICKFDYDNLSWIGKCVLASIMLELWDTIEKDLGYDASIPEFFCAIIQKQQQVNSSAVRTLFRALQTIRLADEP